MELKLSSLFLVCNGIIRYILYLKFAFRIKLYHWFTEAKRFTDEQKNVLDGIRRFLGEEATNYIIAVFSHATKAQIRDRTVMRQAWNSPVRSFIQDIDNRWGIAP